MKRLRLAKLLRFLVVVLIVVLILVIFPAKKAVLSESEPSFSISTNSGYFNSGSLVPIPSTAEPVISLQVYSTKNGTANITLYQTDLSFILPRLVHDKDNKQITKGVDFSSLQQVASQTINISSGNYNTKVNLPLEQSGMWVMKTDFSGITNYFFLIRSDNGVVVKDADKQYLFWGQNFRSKRSVSDGTIKLYNLLNGVKELSGGNFNNEGIVTLPFNEDADIGIAQFDKDIVIIPINLRYFNFNYRSFKNKSTKRFFAFTDRPIYKPGDTVYFKAIIRDDDDAVYTKPSGVAKVAITKDYDEPVVEQQFPVSPDGTVFGEYKIAKQSPTGYYYLHISTSDQESSYASFQVEDFRKPEYTLDLVIDKTAVINQDKASAKVSGQYFFGQPVTGKKVKYQVLSTNYLSYEYYPQNYQLDPNDYFYGYWGSDVVTRGETTLDKQGQAVISYEAKIPADKPKPSDPYSYYEPHAGRNQVFSVMALLDDGSGNPAFVKKNVLVYAGEFDIYRKEGSQNAKTDQPVQLPLILTPHFTGRIDNINLTVNVHRENWVPDPVQNGEKYQKYIKEEEDLPSQSGITDSKGEAVINFTPQKVGFYTLTVNAKDKRDNLVVKAFHFYISSDNENYNTSAYSASKLTVSTDKEQYKPGETARVTLTSEVPDADVFLAVERGRVRRFEIVRLQGKSKTLEMPLQDSDIPNIFFDAISFLQSDFVGNTKKISVSIESKVLKINLTTDKQKYGPGETVQLDITAQDNDGKPVKADTAIWAFDKALLELSDYNPDVIKAFWDERYNSTSETHSLAGIMAGGGGGGGCFSSDTKILLADKQSLRPDGLRTSKRIDQLKVGDMVLSQDAKGQIVKSKVLGIHKARVDGYLIINTSLKATPNHKLWVNGGWKEAGSIQIGDSLKDASGNEVVVRSLEWQKGSFDVYNLEVENTHTFFANSILVHNDKGLDRQVFKDLAYWNPSIHTDNTGKAQIRFQLPDNLTTWVISAVASTDETKVGQTKSEIITQKDVFVRPVLPNILRVGDSINIGTLVHNFTNQVQSLEVSLQTDQFLKGNVSQKHRVTLPAGGNKEVFWPVEALAPTEGSKLVFSVSSAADKRVFDSATVILPILPFEFLEKDTQAGIGNAVFGINLSEDTDKNKGGIILTLSPSLLGPVFDSMKYLIDYGYGCVEQTASKLVPALLVKSNPRLLAKASEGKDIDDIIQKSLLRLYKLQHSGGGFGWWQSGESSYFITAYAVESLVGAKSLGFKISDNILKRVENFLNTDEAYNSQTKQYEKLGPPDEVLKAYALSLLGSNKGKKVLNQLDGLTPDMLSLAVLANIQNGFKNPQTNGLNKLMAAKKVQGDDIYFEAGVEKNFGSQEASTALALRAMLAGGAPDEDIIAAVRYLTRAKKTAYFGNTFATAQAIKALVEFSKNFKEGNPNFSYTVNLGSQQLAQGSIDDIQTDIPEVKIALSEIKPEASGVSIVQSGTGQLYSSLEINQYNTNKNAQAYDHGFSVGRRYENANGNKDIKVGDVVNVKITVSGQQGQKYYAVIKDELPAGLVPINTALNNEQYYLPSFDEPSSAPPTPYPTQAPFSVTDTETTENGMILSIYQMDSGFSTYSYKARAVSSGKFLAPPARTELMYNPSVYGRSGVDIVEISAASDTGADIEISNFIMRNKIAIGIFAIFVLVALVVGFVIRSRQIVNE